MQSIFECDLQLLEIIRLQIVDHDANLRLPSYSTVRMMLRQSDSACARDQSENESNDAQNCCFNVRSVSFSMEGAASAWRMPPLPQRKQDGCQLSTVSKVPFCWSGEGLTTVSLGSRSLQAGTLFTSNVPLEEPCR